MSKNKFLDFNIILYIFITLFASYLVQFWIVSNGGFSESGLLLVALFMWTPGIIAIFFRLFQREPIANFGLKLGSLKDWVFTFLSIVLLTGLPFSILWLTGISSFILPEDVLTRFQNPILSLLYFLILSLPVRILISSILGLGEEIGWRGYLYPKLKENYPKLASILTGLVWVFWHLPLIIWAGYGSNGSIFWSVILYSVIIFCLALFLNFLWERSMSVWLVAFAHGLYNQLIQNVFPLFSENNFYLKTLTGESGFLSLFTTIMLIFLILKFYPKIPKTS